MAVTPERIAKLQALGLSEYAARAYLALLALGPASARDAGTLGRVPMGKIYRALDQLHERGLVNVLPETPKRFAPTPIGGFIAKMQREHKDKIRALESERLDLETEFAITGKEEIDDKGGFSVVRGRKNAIAAFVEGLSRTSRDLFCVVPEGFAYRCHAYIRDLERARARGVKLRFLVPITASNASSLEALVRLGEVRHRYTGSMAIGAHTAIHLHDAKRALVVSLAPDDASIHSGNDVGIATDQAGIVAAIDSLAEIAWTDAPTFTETAAAVKAGRAPVFTHTHRTNEETIDVIAKRYANGARSLAYVNTDATAVFEPDAQAVANALRTNGASARAIITADDASRARHLEPLETGAPRAALRYLENAPPARFMIIDEREAIFPVIQRATAAWKDDALGGEGVLRIHTNDPAIVAPLVKQFDEMWARASPSNGHADAATRKP